MSVNDLFARSGSFQKWQEPSDFDRKAEAEKAREANWRHVKDKAWKRDGGRCRVCRKLCSRDPLAPLRERADPHHIIRAGKGRIDETWNICWIDRLCHDLIHVKRTLRIEGNADETVTVWSLDTERNVWFVLVPTA